MVNQFIVGINLESNDLFDPEQFRIRKKICHLVGLYEIN